MQKCASDFPFNTSSCEKNRRKTRALNSQLMSQRILMRIDLSSCLLSVVIVLIKSHYQEERFFTIKTYTRIRYTIINYGKLSVRSDENSHSETQINHKTNKKFEQIALFIGLSMSLGKMCNRLCFKLTRLEMHIWR